MAKYRYSKYTIKTTPLWSAVKNENVIRSFSQLGNYTVYSSDSIRTDGRYTLLTPVTRHGEQLGGYRTELVNTSTETSFVILNNGQIEGNQVIYYDSQKRIKTLLSESKSAGTLVGTVTAEDGTYPANGEHDDGYWYVRGSQVNNVPTVTLYTADSRTILENEAINISGTVVDADAGNVVTVRYRINDGTVRALTSNISTGAVVSFSKVLKYNSGSLFDGSTTVVASLAENVSHTLRVWAEDDQGGKSTEQVRTFKVIANRPPDITFKPFAQPSDLLNTDKVTVSGSVSDPDGNLVRVRYRIADGAYTEIYNGPTGGSFSFDIGLALLAEGPNALTVQAIDSFGATTTKTLNVTKSAPTVPLKSSVTRYKLTPPNGSAKGVLLWVERDADGIELSAEISMTAPGEAESFTPMTKTVTAYVTDGIEEDEFTYDAAEAKENIVIQLTQTRTDTAKDVGITLISGVLS
ncbi:hypothetical protein [Sporosarcina sp. SAFN-015]|uniref:hypothetical protein n=1 Tax=Sporosarcina sp. SAFN-015 TaxID=3387274 RepID=UPI003F814130